MDNNYSSPAGCACTEQPFKYITKSLLDVEIFFRIATLVGRIIWVLFLIFKHLYHPQKHFSEKTPNEIFGTAPRENKSVHNLPDPILFAHIFRNVLHLVSLVPIMRRLFATTIPSNIVWRIKQEETDGN